MDAWSVPAKTIDEAPETAPAQNVVRVGIEREPGLPIPAAKATMRRRRTPASRVVAGGAIHRIHPRSMAGQ
jgi:hypothetical protein